ncbi:MAG: SUMF1/EgtB/PvdO family nonheme iron enzyme [Chloroflexi bacterium]|nr:SUMF1/EgtB/PvdO family nonheme iron enzyme [Chloroflexota bacterium]
MTKQCIQCQTQLPNDARFCLQCGMPQDGTPVAGVTMESDGAAAHDGGVAAGAGGVAVGGDIHGSVIIGERPQDPTALRRAYLNHLFETVGALSLSGIDPKAASDYATHGAAKARLNLGAVYTALLTLTSEECEQPGDRSSFAPEMRERERLSALAQLDRNARLVLLGDPGSGKSTFVHFVALCMAGEMLKIDVANLARLTKALPQDDEDRRRKKEQEPQPQPWSHGALLPVQVILRDFAARGLPPAGQPATAKHLWSFIAAELESAALADYAKPLMQELLKQGGILLLDGLDEVPEAHRRREQIKQAVEDFGKAFPRCRVLVTSRTYAYQQQAWRLPSFAEAVLAPFGSGQIRRFVDRWYAHIAQLRGLHADDAQGRAELLKRAIFGGDRLRALAERPLLLTLMSSLHAWRGGSLPDRREELYADTVDLLLDWWESPKVVRDRDQVIVQQPSLAEWLQVDRSKVRGMLEALAYQAHESQPDVVGTADVPEGKLLSGLVRLSQNPEASNNPALLVNYLSQRAGLLLPRGVGVYTFPHRTFQEYLAACYLTDHDYPDKVAGLARADPNRWREVALLAGAKAARGTTSAIWSLVDALCYQELTMEAEQAEPDAWGALLAGQALGESADLAQVSERNRAKVKRVQAHLARVLQAGHLPAVERVAGGCILAKLGDFRPGVGVRSDGLPDIVWCDVPAGLFTMGSLDNKLSFLGIKETPQRQVDLSAFRVSKYPVTNAQFAAFVQAGGYQEQQYWTGTGWERKEREKWINPRGYSDPFNLPNHPVVGVSWYEAVAFCLWLTRGLCGCGLIGAEEEITLPSESQWEKAARGEDERVYPWGDDADPERANYDETGIGTTSAAGCFLGGASPYGAEDMSGNVWEWCRTKFQDGYDGYRDDNDLEGGDSRVLRGGSFASNFRGVRCAYRNDWDPLNRYGYYGFRLVVVSP